MRAQIKPVRMRHDVRQAPPALLQHAIELFARLHRWRQVDALRCGQRLRQFGHHFPIALLPFQWLPQAGRELGEVAEGNGGKQQRIMILGQRRAGRQNVMRLA